MVIGMLVEGEMPPLINTSCPEEVCFSTKITVLFFSPGVGASVGVFVGLVGWGPLVVVVVEGPGPPVGPGPCPSQPTQMAKIPSELDMDIVAIPSEPTVTLDPSMIFVYSPPGIPVWMLLVICFLDIAKYP